MTTFPRLLSSLQIRNVILRNRVVVTAHITNLADARRHATPEMAAYYQERARGGVGLIVCESASVHPTSGTSPFALGVWDDSSIEPLRMVAEAIKAEGAVAFAQINHGGREHNSFVTRQPLLAPSPEPSPSRREAPKEMTLDDIAEVVSAFAAAALRVQRAGFDGVEVLGGHGYLIEEFLSPLTNFRMDEYGGSDEGRIRFAMEVLTAVRHRVGPDFVIGFRMSSDQFAEGGIDLEHATAIAQRIAASGLVDYLSVTQSNGPKKFGMIPDMVYGRAPFVDFAAAIRSVALGLPVLTVGRIVDPVDAEKALAAGKADLVGMTRAHIADPYLVRKAAEGRASEIRPCIGCNQGCIDRLLASVPITCSQNPGVGLELTYSGEAPLTDAVSRRVVVVGGGPAGLEAAWIAAAAGHHVVLLEKAGQLGGQVRLYGVLATRSEFMQVISFRERMLMKYGVEVRLNTDATVESVLALDADAVVVATGAEAYVPEEYAKIGSAFTPWDVLGGAADLTDHVIVFDREDTFQALTVAEELTTRGHTVEIVTTAASIGQRVAYQSLYPFYQRLFTNGVTFRPFTAVAGWDREALTLRHIFSDERTRVDGAALVLTGFARAHKKLAIELEGYRQDVHVAGDAVAPRQVADAVREGHFAARAVAGARPSIRTQPTLRETR